MRQTYGHGSIVFESARKKYRAFFVTPAGRRISRRFETRKEAAVWLNTQVAAKTGHSFVEPTNMALGSWLVTWLRDYKIQQLAPKTIELYTEMATKCTPIADIKLQSVTPGMIQSLYTDLLKTLSPSTVAKVHNVLKAAFAKARQIGIIPTNIMEMTEKPRFVYNHNVQTFSPEEVALIYDTSKKYACGRYYPCILLAFTTGMRRGELLALRWEDVNFEANEISITRNLTQTRDFGIQIGPTKTKAGRRVISVPDGVLSILDNNDPRDELIFTSTNHTPIQPRNFERTWANIIKRSNIPYRNFHVIRHTHATDLLAAGVPIADVSRRLGHARISYTLDLYGHALPRTDKEIAAKVGTLYFSNSPAN